MPPTAVVPLHAMGVAAHAGLVVSIVRLFLLLRGRILQRIAIIWGLLVRRMPPLLLQRLLVL